MPTLPMEVRDEERNRRRTGRFAIGQGRIGLGGSAGQEHRCCAASRARTRLAIRAELRGLPKPNGRYERDSGRDSRSPTGRRSLRCSTRCRPTPTGSCSSQAGTPARFWSASLKTSRLLVVGTREHVGLGRLLTSSVSHYCLSHALCPVVAVPAPLTERPPGDEERGPSHRRHRSRGGTADRKCSRRA